MDDNIIESNNLLVNAEECQRLSYEMLFNDTDYQNEEHFATDEEEDNSEDEQNLITPEEHQKELDKVEEKWRGKLEKSKDEAYQQGFDEGEKLGVEKAKTAMEEQVSDLKEAISAVDDRIDIIMDELKPQVATMVFDITEKVIGLPIKSEQLKERVNSEVRQILASLEQDIKIKLEVAATDYGFIVRALKDLPNSERIQITSTEKLSTGEYSIDTQNERIVKNFKKILRDFREKVALEDEDELEVEE